MKNCLIFNNIILLAWEISVVRVICSYSRRLPALGRFTGKLDFQNKSRPTQLRISKLSEVHSCGCPEFLNQNLGQIRSRARGF